MLDQRYTCLTEGRAREGKEVNDLKEKTHWSILWLQTAVGRVKQD